MKNAVRKFISAKIEEGCTSVINVMMLYAEADDARRAIREYDQLVQRFGKQVDFNSDFWNFNALKHEDIKAQAGEEFARADIILLAPDASNPVPKHVQRWMKASRVSQHRAPMVTTLKQHHPAAKQVNLATEGTRRRSLIDLFLELPAARAVSLAH
jgi:hypothetical protein